MSPSLCFIIIVGVSDCILLFYGSKLVFKDLRLYCLFYNPILDSVVLASIAPFSSHNTYKCCSTAGLHPSGRRKTNDILLVWLEAIFEIEEAPYPHRLSPIVFENIQPNEKLHAESNVNKEHSSDFDLLLFMSNTINTTICNVSNCQNRFVTHIIRTYKPNPFT